MSPIQKNSILSLEIESLAYGGAGLAKPEGFVVFVDRALPGDRVRARVTKKSANHAMAVIEAIERPSSSRIEPPCAIFDHCGGCCWQGLKYEDQLQWKQRQVEETLRHIGGQNLPRVRPIIASPEIWNYRNKMEFTFGEGPDGKAILGFHSAGRFDRIFEVPKCLIHPEPFDAVLGAITSFARRNNLSFYHPRFHRGFLRHAVIRHSRTTGGVVVVLITNAGNLGEPEALARELKAACPELQGFIWATNTGLADVATIEDEKFRWGDPVLMETVNGLTFAISPQSFFQTNTAGAEKLYAATVELAEVGAEDRVLDAYCGAGAIGLHCARSVLCVAGIETVREAVWDARANAERNGIRNASFIAAPIQEGMELARHAAGGRFSHVIIDPPRGGMDKKSLAMLIEQKAPVFVYVSCNPSTLARDLQTLGDAGYQVEAVQPVDMFPHTYHIETIVRMRLDPAR